MKPFSLFHQPRLPLELLKLGSSLKKITTIFFIYNLGWGIVAPIFPLYVSSLFNNYKAAGILAAALEFFALLFALFLGSILDRLDKRSMISTALFLYLPFSPILLALNTLTQFIVFRVYHAAIATGLWLTGESYVREHSPRHKESQSIGLFDFGSGLGLVLGGLIGASVITFLGFDVLYSISLFGALAFVASLTLPDKKGRITLTTSLKYFSFRALVKSYVHFRNNRQAFRLLMYCLPYYFMAATLSMVIPLFVAYSGGSLPMAYLISASFYLPLLFESIFSTSRHKSRVIFTALVISLVIFMVLFFVSLISGIFILVILLGMCFAAISPNLSGHMTELLDKKKIGEQTSIIFASKSLAAASGLLTAGFVADHFGLRYVFLIGAGMFVLLIFFHRSLDL